MRFFFAFLVLTGCARAFAPNPMTISGSVGNIRVSGAVENTSGSESFDLTRGASLMARTDQQGMLVTNETLNHAHYRRMHQECLRNVGFERADEKCLWLAPGMPFGMLPYMMYGAAFGGAMGSIPIEQWAPGAFTSDVTKMVQPLPQEKK